jgi:hypothetical protein
MNQIEQLVIQGDAKRKPEAPAMAEYCLYAQTPPGITIGVVYDAPASSLALLAAGVAGRKARRLLRKSGPIKPH